MQDNQRGAVSASDMTAHDGSATGPARFERPEDRGISELVKDLGEQTATLVRKEMELAKAEITASGKRAGVGAGMFGGAGLFGLGAFGALTACLIALIGTELIGETWIGALIVALVYGAIAGVLAMSGKKKVQEATPPVERTTDSVKADVASVKAHAQAGRS